MLNGPFAPWPAFTAEEAKAVSGVLLSNRVNYWTGEEGRIFERDFAIFAGTQHAIALANGTLALDLALHGLRIGSANGGSAQDEVIVTPRSFLASATCVINAGAIPIFADVDAQSQNISVETVAPALTDQTKAIICVHLAGWSCDMDALGVLARPRGVKLIEDCAQAHGATYKGKPVGGLGDVAAWSFCQDKIMSTGGEGGMVTCNDPKIWSRMWSFKDHGKNWDAVYGREHPPGFRWLHESIGTNWRLTEMQSALGRIQLERMPEWHAARHRNAVALIEALAPFAGPDGPVRLPQPRCAGCTCDGNFDYCAHAWYKFYAFIRPENLADGWNRDRVVREIVARGVPCLQGSCSEIYLEKAFDGVSCRPSEPLPVAVVLGETSFMMLIHPTLTKENIAKAVAVLGEVLGEAARLGA